MSLPIGNILTYFGIVDFYYYTIKIAFLEYCCLFVCLGGGGVGGCAWKDSYGLAPVTGMGYKFAVNVYTNLNDLT